MSGIDSPLNKPRPVIKLDPKLVDAVTKAISPYGVPEGVTYEYGTAGVSANDVPCVQC